MANTVGIAITITRIPALIPAICPPVTVAVFTVKIRYVIIIYNYSRINCEIVWKGNECHDVQNPHLHGMVNNTNVHCYCHNRIVCDSNIICIVHVHYMSTYMNSSMYVIQYVCKCTCMYPCTCTYPCMYIYV